MKKEKHYPPKYATGQYHCPHCGVYAKQFWAHIEAKPIWGGCFINRDVSSFNERLDKSWTISKCEHCENKMIWFNDNILYPKMMIVELPNNDLSDEIRKDYLEAATIFSDSPRSSAALLRLALQKLCKQLGEKGDNINNDIGKMVEKGLNPLVQKSLDSLRITGNNAVHPGEINLEEEPDKVLKLFELINFIAEKMMTEPKEISGFYDSLPENSKRAIEQRDKN
jgi:hypothetical protein